jgi:AraC family transcriptional regulator of adaptative response/methylated-DNA-[protein]-cysteine methyltransferase
MSKPSHYQIAERTIRYLSRHFKDQPSLDKIAEAVYVSPFHLQRIFTEWAGISPKKFVQFLTMEVLKKEIRQTANLMEAADRVGLSAQSRVYDLFVNLEAVTPGEFKAKGKDLAIEYGIHPTPFGDCLIACTSRGICSLGFADASATGLIRELQEKWPLAGIRENQTNTRSWIEKIFHPAVPDTAFPVLTQGTPFQIKVWEALLKIPFGTVVSYSEVARLAGYSQSIRAVGTAIAHNPVAYLIPCHRVIRSEGIIGNYHWDPARKMAMIGWEKAKTMNSEQ